MQVDATMFFSAESSLSDASKNLINAQSMASGLTSFPPEFEKVGDINQIISDLSSVRNDIGELERKISNTKDQLCKLSTGFAIEYYQSAMNKFGDIGSLDMSSLSTEEQQYIEMNQKMFNDHLFTYLDKLNSENNLPDEYRDIYNSLKDFKELEKVNEELSRVDKAMHDMMYLTDGIGNVKPTDIDRDEFGNVITTKEERGNRYLYQKQLLENMKKELLVKQEALQRATGTYQNKWYEDIWESMQKTGAAWANVYTTFTNGGSASEVISAAWDATKQTVSTGAVCVESAYSGFKKVKEWVGDGIVATGGTLAAGATWLFHDTWNDNDLADDVMDWWLDYVRTDQVGEARKQFYENNIIGKWNNENSNLKYDSAGAMAIYDASSFAGKAILATGATIATGPAGAVALGALYGAGKSSEEYSQSVERENGENYNYAAAIAKTVAGGVVGASEFYGYGQMGKQIVSGLGGLSAASSSVAKSSKSFLKNFGKNFIKPDTFLDSAAVIVDHGANIITGDENLKEALKNAGIEFGIALGLNAAGAGLSARSETKEVVEVLNKVDDVLNRNNISDTLSILRNLDQSHLKIITNNIDDITSDSGVAKFLKNSVKYYKEGTEAAASKYNVFFKNFREHGMLHSMEVAAYAEYIAKNVDDIDVDELLYAALGHDFGMKGGYTYISKEMANDIKVAGGPDYLASKTNFVPIDDLKDLKFKDKYGFINIDYLDNLARKNHPLNSALTILSDNEMIPENVDREAVALLAMSHSKSTSGIKHFSDIAEWDAAIDKLDGAVKQFNIDNGTNVVFNANKLKSSLRNPDKFARLQNEALAIRDGDAMSAVVKSNDGTLMQDASVSKVFVGDTRVKRIDYDSPVVSKDKEVSALVDEVYNSSGVKTRELANWESFSKKIHAGENNVVFDSTFTGNEYKARVNLVDPNANPNSTFDAIEERLGEINTYTNTDSRSFEIVLPKAAEGKELGNWYKEKLKDLKKSYSYTNDKYVEAMKTKLDGDLKHGNITKDIHEKLTNFYDNMGESQAKFYDNIRVTYE